jgi:tyrosine-protein kinase Etk/Wzc
MPQKAPNLPADSNTSTDEQVPEQTTQTPASLLMDLLTLLTKHRKFISRFVLSVTIVTAIVTLFMPKWYKSTASVFPAEKTDLFGALEGVSSFAKAFSPTRALSSLTGNPEADRYLAILKSGTVLGAVIDKFDLVHVYDITSYPGEKTAKELLNNVEFVAENEGNITITVYDRDPQRAADMANFFVEMLNKTNTEILVQNARANRQFIEERYKKNLADLAAAEDSLKAFQKRYGIIALPEQTEASIKAAAEITGQLALKEVEAGVLRRTLSPDHPSLIAAKIEIQELRNKLVQMNRGSGSPTSEMKVFVPFDRVPDLGGEYVRRYRDVEIQYKILQFVTPLYEQAKVEERRQTPSVVVLDRAGPAERKSKPKVTLYALMALVISLLVSFVVVAVREMIERLRIAHPDRFDALISTLRADWFGIRIGRK